MNLHAIRAIYVFELSRWFRTVTQSLLAPVISTSLYFVVFGSAIGSRMTAIDGVSYAAFIVPGLTMLSLLTESISNASFGIHMPKWSGTIYELLSAPVSWAEAVIGYVGAAATKSILLGLVILATARLFVPFHIAHPLMMAAFLVLTAVTFSLFGFIIGVWADGFEKLQIVPTLIVTPLTFLGGSFYSIAMLPPLWRKVTLFNPVVYLVSGFRWSFYGVSDVGRDPEPRHDPGLHGALPGRRVVDLQDRVQAEDLRLRRREAMPQVSKRAFLGSVGALAATQVLGQTPAVRVRVALTTGAGVITLELAADKAPITAANFLRYVDQKRFDGASFYRAMKNAGAPQTGLVQGGLQNNPAKTLPPIAHESTAATGLSHKDGAISMARYAPGTAASEFFICVGDQPYLDADPSAPGDNLGFAAFGRVAQGMDVARKILASPVSATAGEGAMRGQMLEPPVAIVSARRVG